MTNNLKKLLSIFKEITCPFIASVSTRSEGQLFIKFNELDFLSLNLMNNQMLTTNSCDTYFMEHNFKEATFKMIAIKLKVILSQLNQEDCEIIGNNYIIKTLNNKLYLADDYVYEDKMVDLSSETLPEWLDYTLVDI